MNDSKSADSVTRALATTSAPERWTIPGYPASATKASGPIAHEVAQWMKALRTGWMHPLDKPLKQPFRLFFASVGALIFLGGFFELSALDPRSINFRSSGITLGRFEWIGGALWSGFLVAFAKRRVGPMRLFLEGVLLPAAVFAIIAFSMGRLPSAQDQSPGHKTGSEQNEEAGVRLTPPSLGTESSAEGGRQ